MVAAAGMLSVAACSGADPVRTTGAPAAPAATGRCASARRDQPLVPYASQSGVFTMAVPRRWARTRSPDGVTFSSGSDSLRFEQVPYGAAPTEALVRSGELDDVRRTTPGFRLRRLGTVALPAGSAVLLQYTDTIRDRAGSVVEREVRRYELWRADQRLVLTLASPCGADAAVLYRRVTDSVRWRR